MGGNTFYSNAEAYAFEILQQKLIKEAQKSAQQTVMELAALKSFLGQGQLLYCIPFGGFGHQGPALPFPFPFPFPCNPFPSSDPPFAPLDPHHHPLPPAVHSPSSCSPTNSAPTSTPSPPPISPPHHQSILHVNVKNGQPKINGSDECNLGKDGIEVTIDLREYLPAEISLDVDEKTIDIRARHTDAQGSKTFARKYDLPACIILDSVKCILSHDGVLMFSAAWLKME